MRRASTVLLVLASGGCSAGRLAHAPGPAQAAPDPAPEPPSWRFLREKYDADGDGRITRAEYTRSDAGFLHLDADQDELVTAADFDPRWDGTPRSLGEFVYGEGGPEVGEPAPDFELPTTDGARLSLASFRGKRPVVLVFGSFT